MLRIIRPRRGWLVEAAMEASCAKVEIRESEREGSREEGGGKWR